MKIDRVVVTTFPGYFYSTVLCINSIKKYFSQTPIDIVIDDINTLGWPSYVSDVTEYLKDNNITFHLFSQIPNIDAARAGGWFRQQFVKMYLDQLVTGDTWLLVDADLMFTEQPDYSTIPLIGKRESNIIDIGNRKYVEYFLQTDKPYVTEDSAEYWCASSIPFRYMTRELLVNLRNHVESIHNKNFLTMHTDLVRTEQLVAYDPDGSRMIMSEFQLIEVYRYRYGSALSFSFQGTTGFTHDSIKDWRKERAWFEEQGINVTDTHWTNLINFSQSYAF